MNNYVLSRQEFRDILFGIKIYKRCSMCDGDGYQNWDADGNDVRAGMSCSPDRCTGECDNCDGLGFVYGGHS